MSVRSSPSSRYCPFLLPSSFHLRTIRLYVTLISPLCSTDNTTSRSCSVTCAASRLTIWSCVPSWLIPCMTIRIKILLVIIHQCTWSGGHNWISIPILKPLLRGYRVNRPRYGRSIPTTTYNNMTLGETLRQHDYWRHVEWYTSWITLIIVGVHMIPLSR